MPRSVSENDADLTETDDAELMAVVLEGRHGTLAAQVADFFALLHFQHGDRSRSKSWGGVARLVRQREHERVLGLTH